MLRHKLFIIYNIKPDNIFSLRGIIMQFLLCPLGVDACVTTFIVHLLGTKIIYHLDLRDLIQGCSAR